MTFKFKHLPEPKSQFHANSDKPLLKNPVKQNKPEQDANHHLAELNKETNANNKRK